MSAGHVLALVLAWATRARNAAHDIFWVCPSTTPERTELSATLGAPGHGGAGAGVAAPT